MTEPTVRDRLDRAMRTARDEVGAPGEPPERLVRRVRTKQAITVAIVVATLGAVVFGSVAVVQGTLHHEPPAIAPTVNGPEGNRTTFLDGTRVSYPRSWSLVELPGGGDPAPLFQLTSFLPRAAGGAGCGASRSSVPPRGVLLLVAQRRSPSGSVPRWPVPFEPRGRGCFSARWMIRGVEMEASMLVGPRARPAVRRQMLAAFHGLRFPPALHPGLSPGHRHRVGPGLVVTSGYVAGRPSSYVARVRRGRVCISETIVDSGGPCLRVPLHRGVDVVRTGAWAVVVGTVPRRATSIRAELAGGETVTGEIVGSPPLLNAPFDFFVVELPRQSRGEVTAYGTNANVVGRASFDPPPLPAVARGGSGLTRWMLLDREQSNGVRCIDVDTGHGDQASLCPAAVPEARDVDAMVVPLLDGRHMVVGVVSGRVSYVQVQYLTPKFRSAKIRPFPVAFGPAGSVLPPAYRVFTARVSSTDGAIVVAYDRGSDPIDGMPLQPAGDTGD